MSRKLFTGVVLLALLISSQSQAQKSEKTTELTLKEAVLNRFSTYFPERLQQLQWLPDGQTYCYVESTDDSKQILFFDAESQKQIKTVSLTQLNEALQPFEEELTFIPALKWKDNNTAFFEVNNKYFDLDLDRLEATERFAIEEGAEELTFNGNFSACSYVKDHNLYYLKDDGVRIQVTADGKPGIVYGKAVHRSEFGIFTGMFWAPDNKKLAFYRMDETMVDEYPLVDISNQPATVNAIKYPMAGTKSHHVTLGMFDPEKVKTVYMNTGTPDEQYLTSVTWSPNSQKLFIALLNRDQNQLKLNRYTAATGAFELTLFEEADESYVEPEHPLWFIPHDENKFIWMSERDGHNHLYLYNVDGKLQRRLTIGNWEVEQIYGFDDTKNYLFVEGTGEVIIKRDSRDDSNNATQRYTYMVDFALEGKNTLDKRHGTHMAMVSPNGKYVIEQFSSIKTPWETSLWQAIGKQVKTLHKAPNPVADLSISQPEIITMGKGGENLYGRIIKPSNFDPGKKYPLFLYVYGGPHAQMVRDMYLAAAPLWMYWLAEQGVIVATIDNHGSDNRGLAFEQSTFRNLGVNEMVDQKDFVDYLIQQENVDENRMAVHGWSYGGFMTINMLLTYPGLFKAGIAGGPVCDWSMYEVMYTERYMDTPQANPDGYKNANLIERASALKDDLLVIHGTVDDVVVWQHSQAFLKSCVDQEIQLDYFIYPGHPHNVRGKDRYHLMEKVLTYALDRIASPSAE